MDEAATAEARNAERKRKREVRGSANAVRLGRMAGWLMRIWSASLRVEVDDRCGLLDQADDGVPMIFLLWHDRIFALPPVWWRWIGKRRKQVVLTSASKDGAVVEAALACFGLKAVRGSSHRRGAAAMVSLMRALRDGYDVAVTPDGPKGPRHVLQPGVVKLAEASGMAIVPLHLDCPSAWRLPTWDKLLIPVPFSAVKLVVGKEVRLNKCVNDEAFHQTVALVQAEMLDMTGDF